MLARFSFHWTSAAFGVTNQQTCTAEAHEWGESDEHVLGALDLHCLGSVAANSLQLAEIQRLWRLAMGRHTFTSPLGDSKSQIVKCAQLFAHCFSLIHLFRLQQIAGEEEEDPAKVSEQMGELSVGCWCAN